MGQDYSYKTTNIGKVLAQRGLQKLDQKATEAIIAADKTLDDLNTEIKIGLGGLVVENFSEEIAGFMGIFGLEVDPVVISNVGKVAQTAAVASAANKFIDNFNDTDISDLDEEEILKLINFKADIDVDEEEDNTDEL